jgi:hypothetical protein
MTLHVLVFVLGAYLVMVTVVSAIKTFVLPRAAQVFISRATFVAMRRIFDVFARPSRPFLTRDAVMAMYAPASLIVLPAVWLLLIGSGFAAMYWAVGISPASEAIVVSGSSLFTLGFERPGRSPAIMLTFLEASLGLALVALFVSYLPSIYAAFSRRETAVALLETDAGTPPSVREMLTRHHRINGLGRLDSVWSRWQEWFADIEESHTSIAALVFFRSPQPGRSWITAAACVLDSASITLSCLDLPPSAEAQICIRSGFVALRRLADFFGIDYDPDPQPTDPISIRREEFDALWDDFAEEQLPLKPDREQAWRAFAGWRVNYDTVVRALASLTMAPWAPWSSDRAVPLRSASVFGGRRRRAS